LANKNRVITSPKGVAKFPHLNVPDTKFDEAGVYTVKLRLDAFDAANIAYIAEIEAAHKDALELYQEEMKEALKEARKKGGKAGNRKVSEVKDFYNDPPFFLDEEANEYELTYKMYASFVSKKTGETIHLRPALFDAKNKPTTVKVTGGSIIRVASELVPYFKPATGCGLSLRLKAVQIIDLKDWSTNPEKLGFEVEEGFEDGGGDEREDENGFSDESSGDDDDTGNF